MGALLANPNATSLRPCAGCNCLPIKVRACACFIDAAFEQLPGIFASDLTTLDAAQGGSSDLLR